MYSNILSEHPGFYEYYSGIIRAQRHLCHLTHLLAFKHGGEVKVKFWLLVAKSTLLGLEPRPPGYSGCNINGLQRGASRERHKIPIQSFFMDLFLTEVAVVQRFELYLKGAVAMLV